MKNWMLLLLLFLPLALAGAGDDDVAIEVGGRVLAFIATSGTATVVSPAEWPESDAAFSSEGADALLREARAALTKQKSAAGFFAVDGTRGDDFSFDPATGRISRVSSKPGEAPPCMIELRRQQDGRVRGIRVSIGLIALGFEWSPNAELRFLGAYRMEPL